MSNVGKPAIENGRSTGEEQVKKEYNFQKLTPVQDAPIDAYSKALDYVFREKDIRNIAITGAYGSGKSSVIETYEKKHKRKKFIHLSLAHFENDDMQSNYSATRQKDIRTIEGQLLNQLVNQIPKRNIPETQFTIKQDRKKRNYIFTSFILCLCVLIIYYYSHYAEIKDIALHTQYEWLKTFVLDLVKPDYIIIGMVSLLMILGVASYKFLICFARKKIIRKINVKGNELEIFSDDSDSFFDKYMNEILYLLEHSKADGIIFEDIDRYNNTMVFERLREINNLLYKRQKLKILKRKNPVRFFYLIRDDLFNNTINKDRTKFFDFIIPIVPAVDGNNSYDILNTLFSESQEIWDEFDKTFLRRICIFIDDYRMLKNIYNEFLIYKEKLDNNELNNNTLDNNKLFAMIVYKNIFPHDFAELQFNRGFVYALFKNKNRLIFSYNKYWNDEIYRKEQELYEYDKKGNEEIYELKELDEKMMKEKQGKEKDTWREEYSRRKNIILKEMDDRKQEVANFKHQYEMNKLAYNRYYSMSELLNNVRFRITIDEIIKTEIGEKAYENIKNDHYFPLLIDILKKGLINETYSDYISIIYSNSLTINDKRFVRKVIGQDEPSTLRYDYKLKEPGKIMECLEDNDFTHKTILNYDLFDYLLTKKLNKKMNIVFNMITSTKEYDFIQNYLHSHKNADMMIEAINNIWDNWHICVKYMLKPDETAAFLCTSLEKRMWNNEDVDTFRDAVEYHSKIIDTYVFQPTREHKDGIGPMSIEAENKHKNDASEPNDSIIRIYDADRIKEALCELEVEFNTIDNETASNEFIEFVYQHNLYYINETNIKIMIEKGCKRVLDDTLLTKFMTFILKQDNPFCEHMSKNMENAMEAYFELYQGEIMDPNETVIDIINNKTISNKVKKRYVNKLTTKVDCLDQVEDKEYQRLLIQKGAVKYKGDNILSYYKNYSLDADLIAFINSDHSKLDFSEKSSIDDINRLKQECAEHNVIINVQKEK